MMDCARIELETAAAAPSEADLSQFVAASSDWFWMSDPDLRLTFISKRFFEQTSLPMGKFIGRPIAHLMRNALNTRCGQRLSEDLRSRRPFRDILYPLEGSNRTIHYMRVNGVPAFAADGTFLGYRGTGCNATSETEALQRANRMQADLTKSEERLRGILNHIADGIVTIDERGTIESCNPATMQMFGFGEAELIGQNISIMIPGTERDRHDAYIRRYMRTGKGRIINVGPREVVAQRKDGSVFPMDVTIGEMCLDGRVCFIGAMRDVTLRKQATEELERSRQSLADAQRIARIGNWSVNLETDEIYWSQELYRQLGIDPAKDRPSVELTISRTHPDDIPAIRERVDSVLKGPDRVASCDYRVRPSSGVERLIHAEFRVIVDQTGKPVRMVGTAQDVTELRRARAELERSERMLTDAQRVAQIGSWHTDLVTGTEHWSEGLYRIAGLDPTRHTPSYEQFLTLVHPDDHDKVPWVTGAEFGGLGDRVAGDYRIIRPDGEERVLQFETELLRDDLGRPVQIIGTAQDVTARRAAERELIIALELAQAGDRAKSEFLANISHELRTPLNAIIGFSELLLQGEDQLPAAAKYREYLQDIHNSGRHLLDIISGILDLSKIEAGRITLQEETFEPANIIDWVLRLLREKAQQAGISIEVEAAPELPMLLGDVRLLRQALLNLISNAIKFTPAGGRVQIEAVLSDNGDIEITVADSGIGMTQEEITVALTPFGQVDSTLDRRFEGTGLGLPLARKFIELHGGELRIESTPQRGTTASVILPAARRILRGDA